MQKPITLQGKTYEVFDKINAYVQMRLEEGLPDLYRKAFPNDKRFIPKKINEWMEANQNSPHFIAFVLDGLYVPSGHSTPVSVLLDSGMLSSDEYRMLKESMSFFFESARGNSVEPPTSTKPSSKKNRKKVGQT